MHDTIAEHQQENHTLKFTLENKQDASLLIADKATVAQAMLASKIIKVILEKHWSWRSVIARVLVDLRARGALNQHGQDESVGQHLKTVPAALLCV